MMTTIVTTTINIPALLRNYSENAKFHGHSDLDFVVIGDRKSPAGTREFCHMIDSQFYSCQYLDIDDQKSYLERFPKLWDHLQFDSIQRRNIGILKAYEDGADVIITIDDDNWVMNQDFVGLHRKAGSFSTLPTYQSTSGWFNVCSLLEEQNNMPFYHRGYPMGMRWKEAEAFVAVSKAKCKVAVNAGFWLDDPDIDAITRMNHQPVVRV